MFNYSNAFPLITADNSDCLFVGGPLHDEIQSIGDDVPSVYLATDGGAHVYARYNDSNVFAHSSATPEEIETHIAIVDSGSDLEAPDYNDSVLDYVSGMKDACEQILARFACPNCQPQYN